MIFFQFKIVRTPYYVSVFQNLKREKKNCTFNTYVYKVPYGTIWFVSSFS